MRANRYFEAAKPFRFYRRIGSSLSNTWIGRSRAYNSVYEVLNAAPGMRFHALVGGLFVEFEGNGHMASLTPPKPLLEKSYGFYSMDDHLDRLVAAGNLVEIPKPEAKPDYVAWREASSVEMPPLHPELVPVEASPELQAFRRDVSPHLDEIRGTHGEVATITEFDHYHDPVVGAKLDFGDGAVIRVEYCFIPDFYRVRQYGKVEMPHLAPLTGADRLSREQLLEAIVLLEDAETMTP